jgi:signal transduction histidine kinase
MGLFSAQWLNDSRDANDAGFLQSLVEGQLMNPSIRTKFMGFLALQMIAMVVVGWQGIAGMGDMNGRIKSIYEHQFVPSRIVAGANRELIAWNRAILNHLLAENADKMIGYEQVINRKEGAVLQDLKSLSEMGNFRDQERGVLESIQKEFHRAIPIRNHLLRLSKEGRNQEAQEVLHEELRPIVDAMDQHMTAILDIQESQLLKVQEEVEDRYRRDLGRILLTIGSVLFVSLLLNLLMSEAIIRSIRKLLKGTREFGRGNLDYRVKVKSGDEIQELAAALNSMAAKRKSAEDSLLSSTEKLKLFAYSVIHDLKSPAIGIHGLTGLLQKRYKDVLDHQGKKFCDQIRKASEQLVALVEKVNTYIATKEMPLNIEEINPHEVFQIMKEEFSTQLSIRQVDCSWPDLKHFVRADRLSLLRVFRNLVDNALKYGGEQLSEIRIQYEESQDFHVFSIYDNGVGVKTEDSEKLFGLFQRHETSKGVDGTGLGLAIVKEIAERHQGSVWAEPGSQGGVSFFITISKHL